MSTVRVRRQRRHHADAVGSVTVDGIDERQSVSAHRCLSRILFTRPNRASYRWQILPSITVVAVAISIVVSIFIHIMLVDRDTTAFAAANQGAHRRAPGPGCGVGVEADGYIGGHLRNEDAVALGVGGDGMRAG